MRVKSKVKSDLRGRDRPPLFPHSDIVVHWIKKMRKDSFSLRASPTVIVIKEEFAKWATDYLLKQIPASLYRLV
ncbi:hypothetical protein GN958_ATG07175 [Phytophthora infestans]|uniref:Uncharacterized protein n=1 Tax=Phytophthora infestans TaxID=4787 RepID=A0A8S9URS6_PHYIN|nr:hypothetical protein GN958_ATG07175 [Phytophthora infestans]